MKGPSFTELEFRGLALLPSRAKEIPPLMQRYYRLYKDNLWLILILIGTGWVEVEDANETCDTPSCM